ncbi:MAG: hypothetical protein H6559_35565 [Lewinellaceae bacterium]|nr:hypothetical protein [Lewinellaceae bacterium]
MRIEVRRPYFYKNRPGGRALDRFMSAREEKIAVEIKSFVGVSQSHASFFNMALAGSLVTARRWRKQSVLNISLQCQTSLTVSSSRNL